MDNNKLVVEDADEGAGGRTAVGVVVVVGVVGVVLNVVR
jgi:hypothetical protein